MVVASCPILSGGQRRSGFATVRQRALSRALSAFILLSTVCISYAFPARPSRSPRRRHRSLRSRSPLPALLGCSLVSDFASLAGFLSRSFKAIAIVAVSTRRSPEVPWFHAVCCCLVVFFLVFVLLLLRPLTVYFPHWVALASVIFWFLNSCHVRGKVSIGALACFVASRFLETEVK